MLRGMHAENRSPVSGGIIGERSRLPIVTLFEGAGGLGETVRFVERLGVAGLWSWDVPSGAMDWSRGVFDLLDIDSGTSEASFQRLLAMMHPDDRVRQIDLEALVARGLPVDRQFRVILGNGRLRALEMKGEVLFEAGGRPLRALGLFCDVTARQEVLRLARSKADRYQTLCSLVSDLVVLTRHDGVVVEGDKWHDVTGQDSAMPAHWLAAVHPDDRDGALEAWKKASVLQTPFGIELRLSLPGGAFRRVGVRGEPVKGPAGGVHEWMLSIADMTAERLADSAPADSLSLTGAQIRGARAILNWSVRDLSEASGVSVSTIRRMEEFDGTLNTLKGKLPDVRSALELAGVEFISLSSGKPGVRPR